MSLTCVIVDDYRANAEKIAGYAKRAGLTVLYMGFDSVLALEAIEAMAVKPDVVFLDISMPEIDGLEMAEKLKAIAAVVFTTAHRFYAEESYRIGAVYYLVKPVTYDNFKISIDKVREHIAAKKAQVQPQDRREYITVPGQGRGGLIRINVNDIIYLESASHYIDIHTTRKKFTTLMSMTAILNDLGGPPFIRVHKSFAVNLEKVIEVKDNAIHLDDGSSVGLGSTFRDDFLKMMHL